MNGLLQFLKTRLGGELTGILILAIGVTIATALVTYHPDDSSAFYTSSTGEVRNAIGYYGATLSWILVSFFGVASFLFPVALLLAGWSIFWAKPIDYLHTKLIGFIIVVASTPPLLDLIAGKFWFRGALIPSGGYLGAEINAAISVNLNGIGAAIVLTTAFLIGALLATRVSLAAMFVALREGTLTLGRSLSLQWARFTERRRKEQMKSSVVRKHLERVESAEPAPICEKHEDRGLVVREVKGHGKFQIRKVTQADLREVADEIATAGMPAQAFEDDSFRVPRSVFRVDPEEELDLLPSESRAARYAQPEMRNAERGTRNAERV
ncbi:MAG TPA: DNA translocase FtsK 4TM domain-containing protein, partial [Thermoanaerobaculia bacterium]